MNSRSQVDSETADFFWAQLDGIRRTRWRLIIALPTWLLLVIVSGALVPWPTFSMVVFFAGGMVCGYLYNDACRRPCPKCRRRFSSRSYYSGKLRISLPFVRRCLWCKLPLSARPGGDGDPP